jgi:hypothetical protein
VQCNNPVQEPLDYLSNCGAFESNSGSCSFQNLAKKTVMWPRVSSLEPMSAQLEETFRVMGAPD